VIAPAVTPGNGVDRAPRLNVLAYPRATTVRFIVLVVAMLAAGLFVGSAVFTTAAGASWSRATAECAASAASLPGSPDLQSSAYLACVAPVERDRVVFALGAAAVVALAALTVLLLAPTLVERRRRLRLPSQAMAAAVQRVAELAHEAGLRRPPTLVVGPSSLRDGFCYGRPGRYRIALPTGLVIRPESTVFEAVVRHELAHVAHRDVALAWLARSVWYALGPMLMLPIVVSLVAADLSVLPDYLWRAALLAGVVLLAQRALLRSREHDADLRAAETVGGAHAMAAALSSICRPPSTVVRQLVAHHPDAATRLEVLRSPGRATVVTVVDGVTVAFLAAFTLPVLNSLLISAFLGDSPAVDLTRVISAALVGALMGGTLGLGLWRQALVGQVTGTPSRVAPAAVGVFVGSVAGQAVSFAGTALDAGRFDQPLLISVVALGATGATIVTAGLGQLWAEASGRLRRPSGSWVPATALSALLLGAALWASYLLQAALELGGWPLANGVVQAQLASPAMAALAVVLAAAAGWALWTVRSGSAAPAWLMPSQAEQRQPSAAPRTRHVLAVGAVGGLAGVAVLVGFTVLAGSPHGPAEQEQRLFTYLWLAGTVGAITALLLALGASDRGRGAALLTGPVGAVTVGVGFLALNTARGGAPTPEFIAFVLQRVLAIGLLLYLATACLALATPPVRRHGPTPALLLAITAVVTTGAAIGVLSGRDILAPRLDQLTVAQPADPVIVEEAIRDYKTRTAPDILQRRNQLDTTTQEINADRDLPAATRAARIRSDIVQPLQQLLHDAESYQSPDDRVATVHQHCIGALRSALAAYDDFAVAFETNDQTLLDRGRAALAAELPQWEAWFDGISAL